MLSVAMDAQGATRARPYVDAAGATFVTAVDEENLVGHLYGFKAIPNGFLMNEDGLLVYGRLGSFDIRRAETAAVLDRWAAGSDVSELSHRAGSPQGSEHSEAHALFQGGLAHLRNGDPSKAIILWRQALALDPDNYIIRKQIWAVESPERFYPGDVDHAWQREQTAKGL